MNDLPSSSSQDPLEAATLAEERARVQLALRGLSNAQRTAIELTYFAGMTVNEMAEREQIPLGTAKSRLRLGLERMGKTLAKADST